MKDLFKTMTTAQAVSRLRKTHSDKDILLVASTLPRGLYDAVSSIINKEVSSTRYFSEEREQSEDNNE